jgi:hypothetical protein
MSDCDAGLTVPNGPDQPTEMDTGDDLDVGLDYDVTDGVLATVDTPDPFGVADQSSYDPEDDSGEDIAIGYLPPWPLTRAPGTVATIIPGEIVPINPWLPVIALLNSKQLALLNRESAARQAAAYYVDSAREV